MRRRLIWIVFGLCAVGLAVASIAGADGGGANNVVLVQTSTDGATVARSGVQVTSAGSPTIASANIAEATSSDCSGCSTSAVAVQVVFVTGDPNTVVPGNAAAATTAGCTDCTSFAYAYQYVLSTSAPITFGADARTELNTLRSEIADAADDALPPDAKDAELDALTAQLKALVDAQVERAGLNPHGVVVEQARNS
jgi:hypothetical protein